MILVDTSIWIDFLTEKSHPKIDLFKKIIDNNEDVALTPYIYLEVLQGAKDDRSFQRLREYLDVQIFIDYEDSKSFHRKAAYLFLQCRRKGVTVRSSIDCLIAQLAIEKDIWLLHNDRDVDHIGSVVPELKLYNG